MQGLGGGALGTLPGASALRTPQLDELVGAYPNYNEEEEERRYYRRKRLGVVKNVLAASAGGMLTYGVYLGTCLLRAQPGARRVGTARPLGPGAWPKAWPFPPTPPPHWVPRPGEGKRSRRGQSASLPLSLPNVLSSQLWLRLRPPHVGVG